MMRQIPRIIWRLALLLILVFTLLLAACVPAMEPNATATAVSPPTATAAPPTTASTTTPTTTVVPTEESRPIPTATPTAVAAEPVPAGAQLPETEEVGFYVTGHFGGTMSALDVGNGVAYVGAGPRLLAVDVSDPANPTLLGRSDVLTDIVQDVAVVDGVAYLAAGRGGVVAIDVTDPAALRPVSGGPNYAGDSPPSAVNVAALAPWLFVVDVNRTDGETSLLRFDVSEAGNPVLLEATPLQTNDSVVVGDGQLAVVGNGRLRLLDPANPATVLGTASLSSGSYTSSAVLQSGRALVAEVGGPNGVEVFDISDPANVTAVGDLVEMDLFIPSRIAANESALFTAGTFGEFGYCSSTISIIDISAAAPQHLHNFDPSNCTNAIDVAGDTLYVAGRSSLQIYDVAEPASPALLAAFSHPDGFQSVDAANAQGDVVHLLTNDGSGYDLHTLEVNGDTAVSRNVSETVSDRSLLDLLISGDTLIAPVWMGNLITFDVSDPAAPRLLYAAGDDDPILGDFYTMALDGNVLYTPIIDGEMVGGIGVIDLSDPARPQILSTVAVEQPQVLSIAHDGEWLYVLTQYETNQVHAIDVSDPTALTHVASLTLPMGAGSKLFFAGGRLYAACDGWNCQQLFAIDVADPENMVVAGTYRLPMGVLETAVDAAGNVYLQTAGNDIWLLSAGDPDNLRLTGRLMLPGQYARLKLVDNKIYVSAYDGGLFIVETGE